MSNKKEITKTGNEAYEQAMQEINKEEVAIVKGYILETLKKIESKKSEKIKTDEELRILKKDLEDLRNGNFDKIEERKSVSPVAANISVNITNIMEAIRGEQEYRPEGQDFFTWPKDNRWNDFWLLNTGATYNVQDTNPDNSLGSRCFYF